jgi:hypothetical protein
VIVVLPFCADSSCRELLWQLHQKWNRNKFYSQGLGLILQTLSTTGCSCLRPGAV